MSTETPLWSVVVFSYNELGSLPACYAEVRQVMEKLAPGNFEILLVDDGSTDGTGQWCEKTAQQYAADTRALMHAQNRGVGAALWTGYSSSRGQWVVAVPGDGQFETSELLLGAPIRSQTLYAWYRTKRPGYTPWRQFLSWVNRMLNAHLLGLRVRDVNWIKIYPGPVLRTFHSATVSTILESELMLGMQLHGYKWLQIPTHYRPRRAGHSTGARWIFVWRSLVDYPNLIRLAVFKGIRKPGELA
jgi:glycosyltransferase involved in cell wall biosynthesis